MIYFYNEKSNLKGKYKGQSSTCKGESSKCSLKVVDPSQFI